MTSAGSSERFSVGVDLGKIRDPAAIAIADSMASGESGRAAHAHLRHLERLPLGTPYTAVTDHLCAMLRRPELKGQARLVVDATGVGVAAVDQMRNTGLCPIPVVITGGRSIRLEGGMWRIPKRALVANLCRMMEAGALKLARGLADGPVLLGELQDFQARISAAGRTAFGARAGRHDDLVIAAALACWPFEAAGLVARADRRSAHCALAW